MPRDACSTLHWLRVSLAPLAQEACAQVQHPETRTLCRESRSGSSSSASHAESLDSKLKEPSGSVAGAAACCGATIFSSGVRGSDAKADRRHRQPAVEIPHDSGRDGRGTSRKR